MSLQRLVFIALALAWTMTLGWPLVSRYRRSPDSVGQQHDTSEASRPAEAAGERLYQTALFVGRALRTPWSRWFGQPLLRRRLQVLLGFCLAPFLALFLAIAFGGVFVELVMVTLGMLVGFVTYASLVGRRELQQQQAAARMRFTEAGYSTDEVDRLDGGGVGLFDDVFFEPIPELAKKESDSESESASATPAPTFTPPPWSRPPARTGPLKGRPIYIEPDGDEAARRVANGRPARRVANDG